MPEKLPAPFKMSREIFINMIVYSLYSFRLFHFHTVKCCLYFHKKLVFVKPDVAGPKFGVQDFRVGG